MQEQSIQPEDEVAAATPNEDMKDKQQAVVADKSNEEEKKQVSEAPHPIATELPIEEEKSQLSQTKGNENADAKILPTEPAEVASKIDEHEK